MGKDYDFIMIFNDDKIGKCNEFLQLLKRWEGKVRIGKDTISGHEVYIRTEELSKPTFILFYLSAWPLPVINTSRLVFRTAVDIGYGQYADVVELFYDIFFTACKELKPVFGTADETIYDKRPCMDQCEYYQDPYLFCLEPPLFNYYNFDEVKYVNEFFHNGKLFSKLNEIKRVMSRDELVGIIKKYSKKMIESDDGGIGIFKNEYPQAAYPRYFIRRELRKRGIQVEDGLAEQYAKELGVE